MTTGGLLVGSRITEVLGFKLTELNHTQGFSAYAVALFVSKMGLPVSTTHVSACSIMGLGLSDGRGVNKNTVFSMLFAWITTVPLSAFFAAVIYFIMEAL
jgi:PiT family inorganic phosphate transporter